MRQQFLDLLSIVLTACVPVLVMMLQRKLGLEANSRAGEIVNTAVQRGAGMLYSAAVQGTAELGDIPAIKRLAQSAAVQAISRVPQAAGRLGITQSDLEQMIQAEFGRLLAADPTVSPVPSGTTITH